MLVLYTEDSQACSSYGSTSSRDTGAPISILPDGHHSYNAETQCLLPTQLPQSISGYQQNAHPLGERQTVASDAATVLSAVTRGTPTEYFGESSTFDFMAKVGSPNEETRDNADVPLSARPAAGGRNASLTASSPSAPVVELLNGDCDDPFGLPSRFAADRLVDAYFRYRHPLNPYLHEGTFRLRYRRLWLSQDLGGEDATQQSLSWFGLVNLVFAFGNDHANVPRRAAADRSRYFQRAKCLILSGLLQLSTIDHIQALLLMSQYLHGSLELNSCWTIVGLAIRTAQGLGLHLDPARFTPDKIEQEIRKRAWWGCFVMDRVLCMKVGRPTTPDGPEIEVDMPLAVDDEYLSSEEGQSTQPQGVPSKLEYYIQVITQCRLMEKILETLYGGGRSDSRQKSKAVSDPSRFLASSIELDGELVAWQDKLPIQLRPGAQASEWHFERQRNILLMRSVPSSSVLSCCGSLTMHRFLHARHLVHRQTLLLYITHRVTDPFQQDIMRTCVKRCITAAYDSITQVRSLHSQNKVSSSWHNSHCKRPSVRIRGAVTQFI